MKESESVLRVGEDKNNVTILNSKISTAFRKKKVGNVMKMNAPYEESVLLDIAGHRTCVVAILKK